MIKQLLALSVVLLPLNVWATDLEAPPAKDLADIDHASDGFSIDDIQKVNLGATLGKPLLDGQLNDDFWVGAKRLEIARELYPIRLAKAIVKTDVLVSASATHLYLGFVAHDPNIEELRSSRRSLDGVKDGDYVSIVIDSTGNLRRKYEFRVNPHGSRADILQDTVSNRYIYDWDTRWNGVGKVTPTGYVVEMEIPLDSIRQPTPRDGEKAAWLVILKRSYPRQVDRTFGSVFIFEKDDTITELARKRRLEIKPHFIYHIDEDRDSGESFEQTRDHGESEIGIDAKLIINSGTSIAATVNPNYTDVEADIARNSINNSFTPFQPEKRGFFQDSRELYSTLMPMVYTRNIILPEYGLDYSRIGHNATSGLLWVRDESTSLVMPDNLGSDSVEIDDFESDSTAFRYVTGQKGSAIGLLGTFREASNYNNYVLGVDGLVNLGIDDKFRYQLSYAQTDYPPEFEDDLCKGDDCSGPPPDDCALGECDYTPIVLRADPDRQLNGHGIRLGYKHDGPEGLYWLNYLDYAADFRADFGLDKRTDYRQVNAAYGKKWYLHVREKDQGKSRIRAYVVANRLESSEGEQIENGVDLWGEFRGTFQTVYRVGYRIKERAVNRIDQGSLALGSNAPLFDESYFQWYYETSPVPAFIFNLDGRYGDIADAENLVLGQMTEIKPKFSYLLGDFKLHYAHTYREFNVDSKELYQENFTTLQVVYRPWERHVFRLLLLRDTTDRDLSRFVGDEVEFEKETSVEFTYIHKKTSGLNILAGIKLQQEDDSELNNEFSSDRELYVKLVYDFGRGLNVDKGLNFGDGY